MIGEGANERAQGTFGCGRSGCLTSFDSRKVSVLTESHASEASVGQVRTRTPKQALRDAERLREVSVLTEI